MRTGLFFAAEDRVMTGPSVTVVEVSEIDRGRVLTPANRRWALAVQGTPLVVGGAIAAVGGWVASDYWNDWQPGEQVAAVVIAGGPLVAALLYTIWYEFYLIDVYFDRMVRRMVADRADAVISAHDPDAIYIEYVPRERWHKLSIKTATDTGLLRIDAGRRVILFEGDYERWVIPTASLTGVFVERYIAQASEDRFNVYYVVVIQATKDGEPWEAPVWVRTPRFVPWHAPERKRRAEELRALLAPLVPTWRRD